MRRYVEFELGDGTTIFAEVDEIAETGVVEASKKEIVAKARKSFGEALDTIKPIAASLAGKLRNMSDPPDEMEIQFGLKMNAEMGAVLAASGVEANYSVTLKWQKGKEKNSGTQQ